MRATRGGGCTTVTRRRSATSPRPATIRYLNDVVTESSRRPKPSRLPLRGHFRRSPVVAISDLHLRDDRSAVANEPCVNRERNAGLDLRVSPA